MLHACLVTSVSKCVILTQGSWTDREFELIRKQTSNSSELDCVFIRTTTLIGPPLIASLRANSHLSSIFEKSNSVSNPSLDIVDVRDVALVIAEGL